MPVAQVCLFHFQIFSMLELPKWSFLFEFDSLKLADVYVFVVDELNVASYD